ncbi:DNA glycosylase AlkZ-like family protein [Alkalicoccobacillus murimartini]|uniref:Uncharacterized protein YcaQ n=1 Tax=Alkalicoccobacillus murimartini TaxID=171685 RepID=A0ABT9YIZ7_9BACI|nr:crosslink repair DNA glycosylase YcaQ family protein [Alkalicoccobacillus murimartini]MDQ0207835.1 uncharacterized protein YcaQ [Alkalicoccobacillus murimartini]
MRTPIRISKQAARQFLLHSLGLLSTQKVASTERMWRQLEAVQLDPVATIERNHHLVLMNRTTSYQTQSFSQLLEDGLAFEYWANEACILPIEDYPLFAFTRNHRKETLDSELIRYASTVHQVKQMFKENGPLQSREFRSSGKVHGGWDLEKATTKESSHVLSLLHRTGDIQVVKRDGATRFFDLTENVIPDKLLHRAAEITYEEASQQMLEKYYRAYRLFDPTDVRYGWQKFKAATRRQLHAKMIERGMIVPIEIEGVDRSYAVLAEDIPKLEINHEIQPSDIVQFLPPLDNLLWRRERLVDLFSFYYRWEIYIPKEKRKFGAYAMPILDQDQLIGQMDPLFDRKSGTLIVKKLELSEAFTLSNERVHRIEKGLDHLAKQIGAVTVEWRI